MLSVAEAKARILALADVTPVETVALRNAMGRVLAAPIAAKRTQPPFDASAMDGYAVKAAEAQPGMSLTVIGESAAGHGFSGDVPAGTAARIFTGAPVPKGADSIVIQEDVSREGDVITILEGRDTKRYIRPAGADFMQGDLMSAPRRFGPRDIALSAAMNHAEIQVRRQPVVALIATGDELVLPGEQPGPDQIVSSNNFGLHAMLQTAGATPRILPIARDTPESLNAVFELAAETDLIVTLGGASVGDHDLVQSTAMGQGLDLDFYKIAMRPGKPLMAGRMGGVPMIGLPGNPVSAMVCGTLFLLPMIDAMLGLPQRDPTRKAVLGHDLPSNGPREHYMRARLDEDGKITVFERQDSALLSVLQSANALVVCPPHAPATAAGEIVNYLSLS